MVGRSDGRSPPTGGETMRTAIALGAVTLLAACAAGGEQMAGEAQTNMSHVHMGHVLTSWQDTPDQMGFLPTAQAVAEVAAQHAVFAASMPVAHVMMHLLARP